MIAEALLFLRSLPATPPPFRRHLADAIGLWARGRRQAEAWAPHLANSLGLIDVTIDDVKPRRTVAVLGSGPLFDVPLEALARTFETVLLVDHAHLPVTDARLGRYPNARRLWRELADGDRPLGFLGDIEGLDWVISLNLASQLGRGAPAGAERRIIDAHLDGLAALPCPVTLVTDTDYRIFDEGGALIEQHDLMHGRHLPRPELSWIWEVAPFGEEGSSRRRVHSVSAWADWRTAR